jgi:hypothetical protein
LIAPAPYLPSPLVAVGLLAAFAIGLAAGGYAGVLVMVECWRRTLMDGGELKRQRIHILEKQVAELERRLREGENMTDAEERDPVDMLRSMARSYPRLVKAADEIDRLRAERDALALDAARLDWIEAGGDIYEGDGRWGAWSVDAVDFLVGATLREAIDKAMADAPAVGGEGEGDTPCRTSTDIREI